MILKKANHNGDDAQTTPLDGYSIGCWDARLGNRFGIGHGKCVMVLAHLEGSKIFH